MGGELHSNNGRPMGKRAGAPVRTSLPLHQLLVDQQPAQEREVLVVAPQDVVDLRLRVALSRPEVLRKPLQDDPSLLPPGWYLLDATSFHEIGQDALLPRVIGAHVLRVPDAGRSEDLYEVRTARTTSRWS